jgi:myosin heavy subunit
VSDLKREAALREVSVKAETVNDEELEALLRGGMLADENTISEIANLLENMDSLDAFPDEWLAGAEPNHSANNIQDPDVIAIIADRDRLQQELEALRSQHQFECEYVDQLEQEIISVTNDRDRQVAELHIQLEELKSQATELKANSSINGSNEINESSLSDRLAIHMLQLEEEFQHRLVTALEIETEKISQKYIREISQKADLVEQLQYQNQALDISQQTLTDELEATQILLKESTKTLEIAQTKLTEVTTQRDQFEEELIQHLSNQAKLHQSLRGLENEYVSDLTRVQELEQQIEDLQKQVLQQAAKAAEYEAAIQHWKEQSVRHQHHALQLSGALDRLLEEKPVKHLTQISPQLSPQRSPQSEAVDSDREEHEYISSPPKREAKARSPFPTSKVDLPFFLVRPR